VTAQLQREISQEEKNAAFCGEKKGRPSKIPVNTSLAGFLLVFQAERKNFLDEERT